MEWIAQTQQMLARGEARVRRVDYDNAPWGREVRATSPYRWWLGCVALIDHVISGRPVGLAVEHAALLANPLLQILALALLTALAAWRFGRLAAGLLAVGLATLFPFSAGFLPGVPDQHGFARICGLTGMLLFLAGVRAARNTVRWFALAGVVGGLGIWLDVPTQVPMVVGLALGGLVAAGMAWRSPAGSANGILGGQAWRIWSLGGACTILASYLLDYFPSFLAGWHLEFTHPLYGLAWLGVGELVARATDWPGRLKSSWTGDDIVRVALSVIALAAVPAVISWSGSRVFFARDLPSVRLADQPAGLVAASTWSWIARDGFSAAVWATLLPLVALLPAGWLLASAKTMPTVRTALALALGPVLVAGGFALPLLSWWSTAGGAVLVLVVAATAQCPPASPQPKTWLWATLVALVAAAGIKPAWPDRSPDSTLLLTAAESEQLVERDLAHWLGRHADQTGEVVFAPPRETLSLAFYGGLRGIGTFAPGNHDGFGAALMITAAKSMGEVQAMIRAREVRYVVVPSWDSFFDEFGRLYLAANFSNRRSYLVDELRRGNIPFWLRPLAYPMPVIPGFEKQSVLVFEVVEEQKPAVALGRLAEFLVETGDLDRAVSVAEALRRFPGDVGALAARAQVLAAHGDGAGFAQTLETVQQRLSAGADRYLPWDRRVRLAVVLAQGNQVALARAQTGRCLGEVNEPKLRELSPGSLYQLLVLRSEFSLEFPDPQLRTTALNLLPAELRAGL